MENIPSRHYDSSMEKKPYPSETQERFIVRMPDGMRKQIAASAKANNRSMNAEIVSRLADSYIYEMLPPSRDSHYQPAPPAVNVVLDSRGYPQSWDEIHEHIRAIRRTLGVDVISLNVSVLSPDLEGNSKSLEQADDLRSYYEIQIKHPSKRSKAK